MGNISKLLMVMTFAPVSRGGKGKKFKEKIHLDKSKGKKNPNPIS